jgi:hypothetical protein
MLANRWMLLTTDNGQLQELKQQRMFLLSGKLALEKQVLGRNVAKIQVSTDHLYQHS